MGGGSEGQQGKILKRRLGGIEAREELKANTFRRYEKDNEKRRGKEDGKSKGRKRARNGERTPFHHSQLRALQYCGQLSDTLKEIELCHGGWCVS
jgi:hypothetical protein